MLVLQEIKLGEKLAKSLVLYAISDFKQRKSYEPSVKELVDYCKEIYSDEGIHFEISDIAACVQKLLKEGKISVKEEIVSRESRLVERYYIKS